METIGLEEPASPSFITRFFTSIGQRYQTALDKTVPYTPVRWIATLLIAITYAVRVYLLQVCSFHSLVYFKGLVIM